MAAHLPPLPAGFAGAVVIEPADPAGSLGVFEWNWDSTVVGVGGTFPTMLIAKSSPLYAIVSSICTSETDAVAKITMRSLTIAMAGVIGVDPNIRDQSIRQHIISQSVFLRVAPQLVANNVVLSTTEKIEVNGPPLATIDMADLVAIPRPVPLSAQLMLYTFGELLCKADKLVWYAELLFMLPDIYFASQTRNSMMGNLFNFFEQQVKLTNSAYPRDGMYPIRRGLILESIKETLWPKQMMTVHLFSLYNPMSILQYCSERYRFAVDGDASIVLKYFDFQNCAPTLTTLVDMSDNNRNALAMRITQLAKVVGLAASDGQLHIPLLLDLEVAVAKKVHVLTATDPQERFRQLEQYCQNSKDAMQFQARVDPATAPVSAVGVVGSSTSRNALVFFLVQPANHEVVQTLVALSNNSMKLLEAIFVRVRQQDQYFLLTLLWANHKSMSSSLELIGRLLAALQTAVNHFDDYVRLLWATIHSNTHNVDSALLRYNPSKALVTMIKSSTFCDVNKPDAPTIFDLILKEYNIVRETLGLNPLADDPYDANILQALAQSASMLLQGFGFKEQEPVAQVFPANANSPVRTFSGVLTAIIEIIRIMPSSLPHDQVREQVRPLFIIAAREATLHCAAKALELPETPVPNYFLPEQTRFQEACSQAQTQLLQLQSVQRMLQFMGPPASSRAPTPTPPDPRKRSPADGRKDTDKTRKTDAADAPIENPKAVALAKAWKEGINKLPADKQNQYKSAYIGMITEETPTHLVRLHVDVAQHKLQWKKFDKQAIAAAEQKAIADICFPFVTTTSRRKKSCSNNHPLEHPSHTLSEGTRAKLRTLDAAFVSFEDVQ